MKVIICDRTETSAIERMRAAGIQVDVRDTITLDELGRVLNQYDGMVVRSRTIVDAPLIDTAPNLKIIVRGGVGLDTIDADYARARGIFVTNTPLASSAAVAELTIAYLLMLARDLFNASRSVKAGKWEKERFTGSEIGGKTLGILGVGNIGKEVARRAVALGMRVQAFDPHVKDLAGIELVELDVLLAGADYLTLHLPLTDRTRNIIGQAQFARMKKGVRIINCARGGVIDEDALYAALVSGKVGGAALDVFAVEPCEGHPLFSLENVIASPHIGAATEEAQKRIGAEVADIMIEFSHR